MVIEFIVVAAAFAGGFGLGRVKNKAKLAAAQAEADRLKASGQYALKKL
jgi:hypothetical protein